MSRKEFDASRMRRLRRIAGRHGLTILTSEKIKVLGQPGGHGGGKRRHVVGGGAPDRRDIQVLKVMCQDIPHTRHSSPIYATMVFPEGP